ncbi:MAG TPA: hypothetical protein PLJ34_01105 [Hyphomicrobiales bacterium]|nr:hypothetical protein [Hyphomicrobiales bacterium]
MAQIGRRQFLLVATAALILPGAALARPYTPPRGSAERKAILDALRPRVEREIGAPVEFVVDTIRIDGDWAFVSVTPQRPGGRPIDWARTKWADAWRADFMSDVVQTLFRRKGRGWRMVEFAFGPTDVPWWSWKTTYGLPESFFMGR